MADNSNTQTQANWLIFTNDMKSDWEQSTTAYLNSFLGTKDINVKIELPDTPDTMKNQTLKGEIHLTQGNKTVTFSVVLPYHGVFFISSQEKSTPLTAVWNSWLGEEIGIRCVIPTSNAKRAKCYNNDHTINPEENELEWRIGLPGGNFLNLKKLGKGNIHETIKFTIGNLEAYPQWLRNAVLAENATWATIQEACEQQKTITPTDADDLEHRVLMTFPVWLKYQLVKQLYALLLYKEVKDVNTLLDVFSGTDKESKEKAKESKEKAEESEKKASRVREAFGHRLVPISPNRHRGDTDGIIGLVYVDPKNALDLASRMTRVKRINMSRKGMGEIPEEFRQNHSSFMGRLCPVESPESELVGLSLQLAQGVTVDSNGKIQPATDDDYLAKLGYGAGLIPFFPHNDGARNMMGAKNLRQVLPIVGREASKVQTGGEQRLIDFMAPLSKLGIYPDSLKENQLALGKDLLVAYLPWKGWNMEDAIVVSDSILKDFAIQGLSYSCCKPMRAGTCLETHDDQNIEKGLVRIGVRIERGDVIAWMKRDEKRFPIIYEGDTPVIVKKIAFTNPKNAFEQGILEYTLEEQIPLKVGDKLMGRHGNKGVIGKIVPESEMPKLSPDGPPIQVLLNPHGVISRMNIGQLLETHIGWLLHKGVSEKELLRKEKQEHSIAYPQIDALNMNVIQNKLKETGLDENGRVTLTLPDGKQTVSPVMVGYEHIVRLAHIPMKKIQARGTGKYNPLTGQAVHGRRQGGGQRVGEMEVWALDAYGANNILKEMLGTKSSPPSNLEGDDPLSSGFGGLLKNWLRALLIDCTIDRAKRTLQLGSLNAGEFAKEIDDTISQSVYRTAMQEALAGVEITSNGELSAGIDKPAKVTSEETFIFGICADYSCPTCNKASYGEWLKGIEQSTQRATLGGNPSLRLEYLLRRADLCIASISKAATSDAETNKETFTLELQNKANVQTTLAYTCIKTRTASSVTLEMKGMDTEKWPMEYLPLKNIWCCGGQRLANESLTAEWLRKLDVACPKHHRFRLPDLGENASVILF